MAYSALNPYNYHHKVVCHRNHLGKGIETTNHIERFWSEVNQVIKKELEANIYQIDQMQQFLDLAIWNVYFKGIDYADFLADILNFNNT